MANGIRTGDPCGFNKGRSSKFPVGYRFRQTPEEGRRTYRPKRCRNSNNDEDNNPKTLNDKKMHLKLFDCKNSILSAYSKFHRLDNLRKLGTLLKNKIKMLEWYRLLVSNIFKTVTQKFREIFSLQIWPDLDKLIWLDLQRLAEKYNQI